MTTKNKLKTFFNAEENGLKIIEKYEENITFFNDLLENGHKEDIEFVIPIKLYNYANSLRREGYYSKAITVLDEIEKDLEKLRGQSKWYEIYSEGIKFYKGFCLGRLHKYKKSNYYFKELVEKKPSNDNYVDWYKTNKQNQISEVSKYVIVIFFSIYILLFLIDYTSILNIRIPSIYKVCPLILVFVTWIVSFVLEKIIKKQKLNFQKRKKANR